MCLASRDHVVGTGLVEPIIAGMALSDKGRKRTLSAAGKTRIVEGETSVHQEDGRHSRTSLVPGSVAGLVSEYDDH